MLGNEITYAWRQIRSRPSLPLAVVLTLALGIGANTAIFSFVSALLLRPLPYAEPDRIVTIQSVRGGETGKITPREWEEFQRQTDLFDSVAGWYPSQYNFSDGGAPTVFTACMTTASLFRVFRIPMAAGGAWDDRSHRERNPALVMSHALWQKRFGSRAGIVGHALELDFAPYRVDGVAAEGFDFPSGMDLYRAANLGGPQNWEVRSLFGVARLRTGVAYANAQSHLDGFAARMEQSFPATNRGVRFRLAPLRDAIIGDVQHYVWLTFGLVGAVLLIACGNVVNLLLSRGLLRRREMAVRVALGAGRIGLVRLLLTESLMLALLGGLAGLALAYWWVGLLKNLLVLKLPAWMAISIDGRVLLFTLVVSVITGLLAGLAPAMSTSQAGLQEALREGSRGSSGGSSQASIRSTLVVSELAVAVTLLVLAGLLVKSFWRLQQADPGFRKASLLTFRTDPPWSRYNKVEQTARFYRQALDRLRALPGVEDAAANHSLPLSLNQNYGKPGIEVEGQSLDEAERNPFVNVQVVSPEYFRVMGIGLREGRNFSGDDRLNTTPVAVLSQPLAQALFGSSNPVGKRVRMKGMLGALDATQRSWFLVAGVAGGVKSEHLLSGTSMDIYFSNQQQFVGDTFFIARTSLEPEVLARMVSQAIREVDPLQPVFDIQPLQKRVEDTIWQRRMAGWLSLLFGGLAIVLAGLGTYSVLAYGVSQRTREMGIRQALGSTSGGLRWLILRQGLLLAAPGIVLGLIASGVLAHQLEPFLYGISPFDGWAFASVPLLVFTVAAAACYVPSVRASRVDPAVSLRQE